jgi:hypothetical protein
MTNISDNCSKHVPGPKTARKKAMHGHKRANSCENCRCTNTFFPSLSTFFKNPERFETLNVAFRGANFGQSEARCRGTRRKSRHLYIGNRLPNRNGSLKRSEVYEYFPHSLYVRSEPAVREVFLWKLSSCAFLSGMKWTEWSSRLKLSFNTKDMAVNFKFIMICSNTRVVMAKAVRFRIVRLWFSVESLAAVHFWGVEWASRM